MGSTVGMLQQSGSEIATFVIYFPPPPPTPPWRNWDLINEQSVQYHDKVVYLTYKNQKKNLNKNYFIIEIPGLKYCGSLDLCNMGCWSIAL